MGIIDSGNITVINDLITKKKQLNATLKQIAEPILTSKWVIFYIYDYDINNPNILIDYQLLRLSIQTILATGIEIRIYTNNINYLTSLSMEYPMKIIDVKQSDFNLNQSIPLSELKLFIIQELLEENINAIYLDMRIGLLDKNGFSLYLNQIDSLQILNRNADSTTIGSYYGMKISLLESNYKSIPLLSSEMIIVPLQCMNLINSSVNLFIKYTPVISSFDNNLTAIVLSIDSINSSIISGFIYFGSNEISNAIVNNLWLTTSKLLVKDVTKPSLCNIDWKDVLVKYRPTILPIDQSLKSLINLGTDTEIQQPSGNLSDYIFYPNLSLEFPFVKISHRLPGTYLKKNSIEQSTESIPNILHQIWLRSDPPPIVLYRSWKMFLNSSWTYNLWTMDNITNEILGRWYEFYTLEDDIRIKEEIVTWALLETQGGFVANNLTKALKQIPSSIHKHNFVISFKNEAVDFDLSKTFIGAVPSTPICDQIYQFIKVGITDWRLISDTIRSKSNNSNVMIYPSYYFNQSINSKCSWDTSICVHLENAINQNSLRSKMGITLKAMKPAPIKVSKVIPIKKVITPINKAVIGKNKYLYVPKTLAHDKRSGSNTFAYDKRSGSNTFAYDKYQSK